MKSAIVTGAKGWLGSRLVTHLSKGLPDYPQPEPYEVIGTDKDDLNLLNADKVREFFQQHRGSTVFHTAGIIHPPRVADFYKVNVEATRNVLEAAREAGARPIQREVAQAHGGQEVEAKLFAIRDGHGRSGLPTGLRRKRSQHGRRRVRKSQ